MPGQQINEPDQIPAGLIQKLCEAKVITVLTGAGISAESGIPTFREAQSGLWARFKPEDLATPEAFRRDPTLVWQWYEWRRSLVSRAAPNPGHLALAALEQLPRDFTLITQNVDNLHSLAGSQKIVEIHGNIFRLRCGSCGRPAGDALLEAQDPPACKSCGQLVRPDVVWFGEQLPVAALAASVEAAEAADLFISIGTSGLVQPAASFPVIASRHGAVVVNINPRPSPISKVADYELRGPAGAMLPALVERAKSEERTRR